MDTKLKNWKGIVSFVCISVSILLLSALLAITPSVLVNAWENINAVKKTVFSTSYLQSIFVDQIVERAINNSFTYNSALDEESWFLNQLSMDKNVYIELRKNNKVILKSTHADIANLGMSTKLPKEYGSLYSYRNGRLEQRIGDKSINIYGDNVYNAEKGDICVPGYENFAAGARQREVELLIAFKSNPVVYLTENFTPEGNDNNAYTYSTTEYGGYALDAQNTYAKVKIMLAIIICGIAALLMLLVIGCVFHKHKKIVDAFIAKLVKYIPFELKLFCMGVTIYAWIYILLLGYSWGSYRSVLILPLTIIAAWLIANDITYNSPIYKQSVVYALYCIILQPNIKAGVYRKLLRLIAVAIATFCIGAFCSVAFLGVMSYSEFFAALIFAAIAAAMFTVCLLSIKEIMHICENTNLLLDYLQRLSNGEQLAVPHISCIEIKTAAEQLSQLEQSLQGSLAGQMKSERMKIELIANVSHDIKTPLTSVISYIDLLKEEADLPQHIKEYITVLDEKSQRLKNMVQDIFEVSKAASGQLSVNTVKLDLCRLIRQTLADAQDAITQSGMEICESLPNEPCEVMADGDRMYRVYQNLVANALKYSLAGSRIHINIERAEGKAIVSIKNVSAAPISDNVDFIQRFVRGDESRTDGGSGLGLSIANSFTVACGGKFHLNTNADMFSVFTEFDIV